MKTPILTCPRCGNRGGLHGDDTSFEDVWPTARGHFPVRRCRECGAGLIVRPKFGTCATRATLIPDATWSAMQESLSRDR